VLLRLDHLDQIVAGDISVVYRLWRKPTVKAGGRLRTPRGELAIDAVDEIDPATISDGDALRAGFASAKEARASVAPRPVSASPGRARTAKPDETSRVYRVTVHFAGEDPRAALREDVSPEAIAAVVAKLDYIDRRSTRGPWTRRTLDLIAAWPGRRAPELAEIEGLETLVFKNDVRKLKELGLTISLSVGYEVSPRGEAVRAASLPR
jgi:hypothetical protein